MACDPFGLLLDAATEWHAAKWIYEIVMPGGQS
jgi:hypothetical protein